MPRPCGFDRDEILDRALAVFWEKGYTATTLADLLAATGLARSSLYAAFGDKHGLFCAVLDRYVDALVAPALAPLADPARPCRIRLEAWLRRVISDAVACGDRRGCFLGNTAAELAPRDPAVAARVRMALERVGAALHALLEEARETGEIDPGKDALALSRFFTATGQGLRLMAKAGADPRVLDDVVRQALSVLEV